MSAFGRLGDLNKQLVWKGDFVRDYLCHSCQEKIFAFYSVGPRAFKQGRDRIRFAF